jgi:Spy/CpxP family protein refolding chaperone
MEKQHMRNKLYTFALTGLLVLGMAGSVAVAQDDAAPPQQNSNMQGHRGTNPDMQLQHLTQRLNLSSDQQSQIKPVLESQQQQMQQLWQDQSLSREDRHQKMMAIHQDTSQKIEAVLNDTQKQQYAAMQSRMGGRRMRRQQQPPSDDSAPPSPQQ